MSKPVRVLMINYEFPPLGGGAANANYYLLQEMAKIGGIEIDLLTSFSGKGVAIEQFSDNITIHKVGINKKSLHHWRKIEILEWLFRSSKVYKTLIAKKKYDLTHAFFAFPSGWFCWKSRKQLPYIISLRGSDVPGYNDTLGFEYAILERLFKSIWQNAAFVVANSKGLATLAGKFMPQLKIDIIPNGVSIENFDIAKKRAKDGKLRLLVVGRLVSRKKIDVAIKALPLLLQKGIDASLTVAGGGVLYQQLNELAQKLDLAERVSFLSEVSRSQMPELYADADIFLMCSRHEGMSNAMLEAMAAGLPIITSDCEGVGELIDSNGIILEDTSAETVADAVERLINDQGLSEVMSEASKQIAKRFSWHTVALAYAEKYRLVANERLNK